MASILWFVIALFTLPCMSEGSKILLVFPTLSKSHGILGDGFVRILLKAGHEVTYITSFPKTSFPSSPKLRLIDASETMNEFPSDQLNIRAIIDQKDNIPHYLKMLNILKNLGKFTLNIEQVKKFINDPNEKFDLVIIEWMFSELYVGLAALFDCPYIWSSSIDPHSMALSLIDEGLNPAYHPQSISSNVSPFNFFQRVQELFTEIFISSIKNFFLVPYERRYYEEIFGPIMEKKGRQLPTFDEMRYNASLMFGNSDVSTGKATRLPQNYKAIGGYHIDPEVKPLPEDIKKIMEKSDKGVIYFSMGSILKSKDLPNEIKESLLKMFGQLKYTVIWKFEEQLAGVPKNVHILQWAPQASILAHPKCKLFITHGGLLSTTEAINFGVPIIGVPVFGDQFVNVAISKQKGFALQVDLSYYMSGDLKLAIEEILSSPKYKEKMDELNFIFHDRPVTPAAELAHWVNHVIRTKGAPHLRSVALLVPWYQKLYLDLFALVFVVIFIIVKAIKLLCCIRKKTVSAKKKNN